MYVMLPTWGMRLDDNTSVDTQNDNDIMYIIIVIFYCITAVIIVVLLHLVRV